MDEKKLAAAIHMFCISCEGRGANSLAEQEKCVKDCKDDGCSLWQYRMGE